MVHPREEDGPGGPDRKALLGERPHICALPDSESVTVTEHYVEASFTADLPSSGGKVNALAAEELIFGRIGRIVAESLMYRAYKPAKLYNHIHTADNAEFIRSMLPEMGLVAFVATGAVLPRRDDDLAPLTDAVPFDCDECLKVTMAVPHGEPVTGLGIREGFTVLAGCSRAGKSVLLDAILAGVHDHIPGDGREYVVSVADASYIMSEAGRPADAVDVSPFLPGEESTRVESPSVPSPMSELVAISEAVEMGSRLILVDEEYSNPCIIRRGFLAEDDDLIPLSELGRSMGEAGVSIVMVSGDRCAAELADRVLRVEGYHVSEAGRGDGVRPRERGFHAQGPPETNGPGGGPEQASADALHPEKVKSRPMSGRGGSDLTFCCSRRSPATC